jgi:hypothetical protein
VVGTDIESTVAVKIPFQATTWSLCLTYCFMIL